MRRAKPIGHYAVFTDAVENAIGTDDCCVYGTSENHCADDDDENVEDQSRNKWTGEIHGEAADEVFEEALANVVRDDHDGEEGDE